MGTLLGLLASFSVGVFVGKFHFDKLEVLLEKLKSFFKKTK